MMDLFTNFVNDVLRLKGLMCCEGLQSCKRGFLNIHEKGDFSERLAPLVVFAEF